MLVEASVLQANVSVPLIVSVCVDSQSQADYSRGRVASICSQRQLHFNTSPVSHLHRLTAKNAHGYLRPLPLVCMLRAYKDFGDHLMSLLLPWIAAIMFNLQRKPFGSYHVSVRLNYCKMGLSNTLSHTRRSAVPTVELPSDGLIRHQSIHCLAQWANVLYSKNTL